MCNTESKSRGECKKAKKKGCKWLCGEEPGCCYSDTGNSMCALDDESACKRRAKAARGGCVWRSGLDADCTFTWPTPQPTQPTATPTPAPGCCRAGDYNKKGHKCADIDVESACELKSKCWGCEWMNAKDCEKASGVLPWMTWPKLYDNTYVLLMVALVLLSSGSIALFYCRKRPDYVSVKLEGSEDESLVPI